MRHEIGKVKGCEGRGEGGGAGGGGGGGGVRRHLMTGGGGRGWGRVKIWLGWGGGGGRDVNDERRSRRLWLLRLSVIIDDAFA